MSHSKKIKSSLFYFLGISELIVSLIAVLIILLFAKFAQGSLYDFILSFFPDVSLLIWSILGFVMLVLVQILGNFIGAFYAFNRSFRAGNIAMILGLVQMFWTVFEYFVLHIHNILMLPFFILALATVVLGALLNAKFRNMPTEM